jgi:hypothetical protein
MEGESTLDARAVRDDDDGRPVVLGIGGPVQWLSADACREVIYAPRNEILKDVVAGSQSMRWVCTGVWRKWGIAQRSPASTSTSRLSGAGMDGWRADTSRA